MRELKLIIIIMVLVVPELMGQVSYTNGQWGFEVEMIGKPQETFYEDGFHLFMEKRTQDRSKYLTIEIDIFRFDQIIKDPLAFSDSLLAMEFLSDYDNKANLSLLKRDDIEVDSIPGIQANIKLEFDKNNILNLVYMSFCIENIYYVIMFGSPTQTFEALEEHAKSFRFIKE